MTQLLLRDLPPGQDYILQLRSVTENMVSEWSQTFEFTTINDNVAPKTPTGFDWDVDGTSFVAKWNAVTTNADDSVLDDFAYYELTLVGGGITVKKQTRDINFVLTFEENKALFDGIPRATVSATLRAWDTSGNASDPTATISVSNPPPQTPAAIYVTSLLELIDIKWTGVTDTDLLKYVVSYALDDEDGPYVEFASTLGTQTSFPSVLYDRDHYFRVHAVDVFNTPGGYAQSEAVRPKTSFGTDAEGPPMPDSVSVVSVFDAPTNRAYLDVTWEAVDADDLANYTVRYASSTASDWLYVNVPGIETAVRIPVAPDTEYYVGVNARDYTGNSSLYRDADEYPITSAKDDDKPGKPAIPTVAASALQIQVTHSGKEADNVTPLDSDVSFFKVYAKAGADPNVATDKPIGTMSFGVAIGGNFPIPATGVGTATNQSWRVRVVAVDGAGNESLPSDVQTQNVPLIDSTFIAHASITSAKITELEVQKLTAGTGLATNFTIKSVLTLGESGGPIGSIQSWDFNSGTRKGFRIASDGLKIYEGEIDGTLIRLQNAPNILPNAYANFELDEDYYLNPVTGALKNIGTTNMTDATFDIDLSEKKFGNQSLKIIQSSGTGRTVFFAPDNASDNIYLNGVPTGTDYFVSIWVRPTVTNPITLRLCTGNTTILSATAKRSEDDATTLVANTWQQVYILVPGTTESTANMRIFLPSVPGTWNFDGAQVERKMSSKTTPGDWAAPSTTVISGGAIQTGTIQSNTVGQKIDPKTGVVTTTSLPAWSIDMEGDATFNKLNVRGSIIVGDQDDVLTQAEIDAQIAANDALPDEEKDMDFYPHKPMSTIQSANYTSAGAGWRISGDGSAEFNQIRVGSLNAVALKPGSVGKEQIGKVGAEIIDTGLMEADLTVTGSLATKVEGTFLDEENGNAVTADLSKVTLDAEGIIVWDRRGAKTTVLGSNGKSTFDGDVTARSLAVNDGFTIGSNENFIMPKGVLNLGAKTSRPAKALTPQVTYINRDWTGFDLADKSVKHAYWDGSYWVVVAQGTTTGTIYFLRYNSSMQYVSTLTTAGSNTSIKLFGGCVSGGKYVIAYTYATAIYIQTINAPDFEYYYYERIGTSQPAFSYNTTTDKMYIAVHYGTSAYVRRFTANGAAGSNVVPNGNMETGALPSGSWAGTSPTVISQSSTFAKTGTYSLRATRTTAGPLKFYGPIVDFSSSIGANAGIDFGWSVRAGSTSRQFSIGIQWLSASNGDLGGTGVSTITANSSGWTDQEVQNYIVPVGATKFRLSFESYGNVGANELFYFDDVFVKKSPFNIESANNYGSYAAGSGPIRGFMMGAPTADLGGNRNIFAIDAKVGSVVTKRVDPHNTGTLVASESWYQDTSKVAIGLNYDGNNFWQINSDNTVSRFEKGGNFWTTDSNLQNLWWYGNAWFRNGSNLYTDISDKTNFYMKKRAMVVLPSRPIPASAGSEDPNSVIFYLGKGTTAPTNSNMYAQFSSGAGPSGGTGVASVNIFDAKFTTTADGNDHRNPSSTNNFPDVTTPGKIMSNDTYSTISLEGSGKWQLGPMYFDPAVAPSTIGMYSGGALNLGSTGIIYGTNHPKRMRSGVVSISTGNVGASTGGNAYTRKQAGASARISITGVTAGMRIFTQPYYTTVCIANPQDVEYASGTCSFFIILRRFDITGSQTTDDVLTANVYWWAVEP